MALTQISTKGIKDGTITGTDLATNVDLVDNQKIRFGAGDDLAIFHDGTDNLLSTVGTVLAVHRGTTNAGNPVFEVRSNHGATNQIKFQVDGDGDVLIPTDTGKLQLGVSQDLQIFHNGSNSVVRESGAGQLQLESNTNIVLGTEGIGETYLKAVPNGTVELYHNNSKKFETSSTGVTITGDANWNDNGKAEFGNAADLQIYHDGSHSYITNATNDLRILANEVIFNNAANTENKAKFINNGAVELYYDNSKKLETTSSGVAIGGTTNASTSLHVENSSGDAFIRCRASINYGILMTDASNGNLRGFVGGGGAVNLGGSNLALSAPLSGAAIRFQTGGTNSGDEKVRITGDSTPTLLIGQTSVGADANGWTLRGAIQTSSVKFTSTDVRTMFFMSSYHSTGSQDTKFAFHSNGTLNATNTTIQAFSSERRTKKNIVALNLEKAWNTLRDTPFYTFNYKNELEGAGLHHGPIVDECPEDLIVPTQKEDEVGIINTVNTEKLQYRAYSALQQAIKKIEVLETEVAALKAS